VIGGLPVGKQKSGHAGHETSGLREKGP
jgi:hypothetical protein